ncbi:hypothetical protein ABK040_003384 [Willaertia magna]
MRKQSLLEKVSFSSSFTIGSKPFLLIFTLTLLSIFLLSAFNVVECKNYVSDMKTFPLFDYYEINTLASTNNDTDNGRNSSYPLWIPWVICASVFFGLFILSTFFAIFFQDKYEKGFLSFITTVIGLAVILFSLAIVPIDIFNVSYTKDPTETSFPVKLFYYICYGLMFLFSFVIIPFTYFWYEEEDSGVVENKKKRDYDRYSLNSAPTEEVVNSCCNNVGWRVAHSLKFTIFTILFGILILATGLIISIFSGEQPKGNVEDWLKHLIQSNDYGDRSIRFIIGCIAVIGTLGFNIYTAYGLSFLPISLMKRRRLAYSTESEVKERIDFVKDRIRLLRGSYRMKGKEMNNEDQKEYDNLNKELTELRSDETYLSNTKKKWSVRIEPFIYPFKLLIGFLILVIVIFLVTSLCINMVYRTINSKCGILCGFQVEEPCKFNPLDLALTYSSIAFPVDYILLALIILLFIVASMTSLSSIGLRILCINLYKLKFRRTVPQGLVSTCIFLMFIMIVTAFMLPSFAPQYTTFGSQKYRDPITNEWTECTLASLNVTSNSTTHSLDIEGGKNTTQACFMTEISQTINTVVFKIPIFSIVFYIESWAFVLCFLIGFVVAIFKKPASFVQDQEQTQEDKEEEFMRIPLRSTSSTDAITRRYSSMNI